MKKCEEKAPTNEEAALRGMMIKNFGTGEQRSAGEATGAQEKKMKYLRKKTEAR